MASVVKTFNVPFDHVLYEMSFSNVTLYSRTIPTGEEEKEEKDDTIDADDPRNREKVKKILFG